MYDEPQTLEEAKHHRYNRWAGNPKGYSYEIGKCAYEIYHDWLTYQCSRKNGHGIAGLYCKQHAKKVHSPKLKTEGE